MNYFIGRDKTSSPYNSIYFDSAAIRKDYLFPVNLCYPWFNFYILTFNGLLYFLCKYMIISFFEIFCLLLYLYQHIIVEVSPANKKYFSKIHVKGEIEACVI